MTVNEVAMKLNKDPMTIRVGLQMGVFPFGTAFKTNPNNKRWVYVIYNNKVEEYLG